MDNYIKVEKIGEGERLAFDPKFYVVLLQSMALHTLYPANFT